MPNYVLVSPAGNEHPTDDEGYRNRLLAQGYREKPQDQPQEQPQEQPRVHDAPAAVEQGPAVPRSVKPPKSSR